MAIRTLSDTASGWAPVAIHIFVDVFKYMYLSQNPNLGILWISMCSFWLWGSIVAYPMIYRYVPSPSRFEIRQCAWIPASQLWRHVLKPDRRDHSTSRRMAQHRCGEPPLKKPSHQVSQSHHPYQTLRTRLWQTRRRPKHFHVVSLRILVKLEYVNKRFTNFIDFRLLVHFFGPLLG